MNGQATPMQDQCSREKYWKELSIEEKLERSREQVNVLRFTLEDVVGRLYSIEQKFGNHAHLEGDVVMPVHGVAATYGRKNLQGIGLKTDEVYF